MSRIYPQVEPPPRNAFRRHSKALRRSIREACRPWLRFIRGRKMQGRDRDEGRPSLLIMPISPAHHMSPCSSPAYGNKSPRDEANRKERAVARLAEDPEEEEEEKEERVSG